MTILSSLRNRIFLASALLAMLCIGLAIFVVNVRVTQEAERTLERDMVATAALVDNLRTTRTETFTQMARFIADAPPLKAAVDTNDPPTVQDVADGYQHQVKANLLIVTNRVGRVLATVGASARTAEIISSQPAVRRALAGQESYSLLPQPDGVIQLVTVPVFVGLRQPDMLGTLSVGFMLDNALAGQLKQITLSDIAFGMNGQILAATLPRTAYPALAGLLRTSGLSRVQIGAAEYEALSRPLSTPIEAGGDRLGPVALILRSRTEQLRFLEAIHAGLVATGLVAVLLATLLSFGVARTVTRPLAAITDVMRDVAATGDLTRKIALGSGRRWPDADARLLADTFNTLTDSIARFQREISQKERLSSLGRLSTVIAHEIRNPLMIIKASLHGLRRPGLTAAELGEAVADIDEEVARLNRIVNEVLDFARPVPLRRSTVDLNAFCRECADASVRAGEGATVHLDLAPEAPPVTIDPDRLRIALVNLLTNARQAVAARNGDGPAPEPGAPLVTLRTAVRPGGTTIVVADRGVGIDRANEARVFDPFFTTRPGGTGLGLAIAKTIVEGLGGTIAVASVPGRGTEFRIDLPSPGRAAS